MTAVSVCEVIRDPKLHMGAPVAVGPAEIVHCDLELKRIDIAAGGGKLMVSLSELVEGIPAERLGVGQMVSSVTGLVRKQARRTYFAASHIVLQ